MLTFSTEILHNVHSLIRISVHSESELNLEGKESRQRDFSVSTKNAIKRRMLCLTVPDRWTGGDESEITTIWYIIGATVLFIAVVVGIWAYVVCRTSTSYAAFFCMRKNRGKEIYLERTFYRFSDVSNLHYNLLQAQDTTLNVHSLFSQNSKKTFFVNFFRYGTE